MLCTEEKKQAKDLFADGNGPADRPSNRNRRADKLLLGTWDTAQETRAYEDKLRQKLCKHPRKASTLADRRVYGTQVIDQNAGRAL